jgi:LPS-assembly lipoprotein
MKALAVAILCVGLAACGFHLAGTRPMPETLKLVHIDMVAPYRVSEPAVETMLRTLLTRRGSTVVDKPKEGATQIRLSELEEIRQVLSVGADGKALEFQLITRVTCEVRKGDQVLMPPDRMMLTRDYSFNAQQVLAKESEEERLREFLQNELAELLLLRIEAAAGRAVAPAPPPDAAPPALSVPPAENPR